MNILVVSISAPPKIIGAECLQVGKYLKYLSINNSLSLVTTPPSGNTYIEEDEAQKYLLSDINQTIELKTFSTLNRYTGFIPRRIFKSYYSKPDGEFLFHHQAGAAVRKLNSIPDIIYSRAAPFSSSVMGLKIKKLLNKPWVMHLSDPWTDSSFNEANSYSVKMEKECFSMADKISFTTPETKAFYSEKYPEFVDKYFVCPNVYDFSELTARKQFFTDNKVKLLFSGSIYGKRSIYPLIESLKLLDKKRQNMLDIRFIGYLEDRKSLDVIHSSQLDCVKYDGFVTPGESYIRQREADLLITIDQPVENEIDKVYLPSKIQDYMAAGRFILAITGKNSATYNVVHKKYGVCFEHQDICSLLKFWNALTDAFVKGDYSFLKIQPLNDSFEAQENAQKLLSIFQSLINKSENAKI